MSDFKFLSPAELSWLSCEERQAYYKSVLNAIDTDEEETEQMVDDVANEEGLDEVECRNDEESDAEMEQGEIEIGEGDDSDYEFNDIIKDESESLDPLTTDDFEDGEETKEFFSGEDGTKWHKKMPAHFCSRHQNIFRDRFVGPNPATKNLSDVDTFCGIMHSSMIAIICRNTNLKAEKEYNNFNETNPNSPPYKWEKVDEEELLAYFGILLTMGSHRTNYERLSWLWRNHNYPLYRATMSSKRFRNITRFIRFDQQNTRAIRMATDKTAPISEIFEMLNANLRQNYKPLVNITVDEQLFPFRGRTKFSQYMPSKPAKYGIKLWWACDTKTYYPLTGQIYKGKHGNTRDVNEGEFVVKNLVEQYKNTGRNIIMDTFFTTISLADTLRSWKLSMVGAIKKNMDCIPPEFKPSPQREILSTIFGFHENRTICSYVPQKNKATVLLSTMHFNDQISNVKRKPEMICFYNSTKGSVDTMDKMLAQYTTKRKTNRWPLALFFNLLDVAALAAYIIYAENNPSHLTSKTGRRREFLQMLGEHLCLPLIERRAQNPRVTAYFPTKAAIECMLGCKVETVWDSTGDFKPDDDDRGNSKVKGVCFMCYHESNKRKRVTRKLCVECRKPVCVEHSLTQTKCLNCHNE